MRPRRAVCLALAAALCPWDLVRAGPHRPEPLSDSVRSALAAAAAAPDSVLWPSPQTPAQADAQWLAHANHKLTRYMRQPAERLDFLNTLWYEARRAGLPLSLVLAVVQVESGFRQFAVSVAGARGHMQIMPFWSDAIGDGAVHRLFQMPVNLRFGCVILRHYLDLERGHVFMALGRYNGSRGQAAYPHAVWAAQRQWLHPVD